MAGQQGQPKYGFGWPDGRLGGLGPPGQREARPLLYTHTPHTLLTYTDNINTQSELYTIHGTCVNSRKRVPQQFNSRN